MPPLAWYEVGHNLSSRIIQAARSVYECLGPGFNEEEYRKAIVNTLEQQRLEVQRRFPIDVWQGRELAELYFLDLFVECQVIVQVMATGRPISVWERDDMVECLAASGAPLGLVLNFGRRRLEYERIFPKM